MYYKRLSYSADPKTPIHNWFLINESSSLEQVGDLLNELHFQEYDLVIDPFCGSGTVGLQCTLNDQNFLGFEILGTCVIGSRAKLNSLLVDKASWKMHEKQVRSLLTDILNQWQNIPWDLKRSVNLLQRAIINHTPSPLIYLFLASIYSAAFIALKSKIADNESFLSNIQTKLERVTEDLESVHWVQKASWQEVIWANSSHIDWKAFFEKENIPTPSKLLMVTSPNHVNSSRDRSKSISMLNDLAQQALDVLGDTSLQSTQDISTLRLKNIEITAHPRIYSYLCDIQDLINNFYRISSPGSKIVIECENAMINNTLFEADLFICALAVENGLDVDKIRVTHYVNSPGSITNVPNSLRGSLVYLSKNI
jgi:hypothetical protein